MRLVLPLLAFALTCCATVNDIYASSVDETQYIDRPLTEVSQCLQFQLGEAPVTDPQGQTTFIIKNGYQVPLAVFTLTEEQGRSRIDIRRTQGITPTGVWRKCLPK